MLSGALVEGVSYNQPLVIDCSCLSETMGAGVKPLPCILFVVLPRAWLVELPI